ncbi:MAG: hypothetical protein EXR78_04010 [Deltaproteobacteria bacterium]|nr:hypothetical protein [Deltaproteobacteria bacterium]
MAESLSESPAKRYSRLFRKAGVFLAKARFEQALVTLREGEAFALALGDTEKLALFREEILRCEQRRSEGPASEES